MHSLTPIGDVMTRGPVSIDPDLALADARDRMSSDRIRHLPVVREGRLVGILTARDILLFEDFEALSARTATVDAVMTADPVTVSPDETLGAVLELMVTLDIGAVLVKERDALVGIFTDVDAARLLRETLNPG